ncbi:ImmA/IrrE family metallo-endopeptidase [Bacillus inaquosorum]|uniref:ImmA/IrrE family metallo-endopeptidase n=1 Tax=Bacillus inaquosorum TaxID=483913 RepID=UPI00227DFD5A|nr:ImmA/IrrE family metallo-endopeptidase [Bacillus inaquosorum]MCY9083673.1 ImmA/IrrE family metallo-endopeptidase [Bacillus inaquosorum]
MIDGKVFRVGGVDYSVETVPELNRLYNLWGQVTYQDTNIQIDKGLSLSRVNNVLIHEITHAIFHEAGFMEQDEEMINRVASVLTQVLRDNDFGFIRETEGPIE